MEANTLNAPDPLESFKVGAIPTCYYVPDFITEAEENYLLKNVRKAFRSFNFMRSLNRINLNGKK